MYFSGHPSDMLSTWHCGAACKSQLSPNLLSVTARPTRPANEWFLNIWKYFTRHDWDNNLPVITTGNMLVARLSSLAEKSHVTPVNHVSPTIAARHQGTTVSGSKYQNNWHYRHHLGLYNWTEAHRKQSELILERANDNFHGTELATAYWLWYGSEWRIIIPSTFCGILPGGAGGKVSRRGVGRKLLGKYLTVFSHWHWLISTPLTCHSISDYNTDTTHRPEGWHCGGGGHLGHSLVSSVPSTAHCLSFLLPAKWSKFLLSAAKIIHIKIKLYSCNKFQQTKHIVLVRSHSRVNHQRMRGVSLCVSLSVYFKLDGNISN